MGFTVCCEALFLLFDEGEMITNRKAKKFTTRTNCKEALGAERSETPQGKRPAKGAECGEGKFKRRRKGE